MKTIYEKETITVKKFVAKDGMKFRSQEACLGHERELRMKEHPLLLSCISGLTNFEDGIDASLYYISNQSDVEFLQTLKYAKNFDCDFDKCGPGWYLYYSYDGGDGPDFHTLINYENYEKTLQKDFDNWKKSIHTAIKQFQSTKEKQIE